LTRNHILQLPETGRNPRYVLQTGRQTRKLAMPAARPSRFRFYSGWGV
jgi:hypothetical protein